MKGVRDVTMRNVFFGDYPRCSHGVLLSHRSETSSGTAPRVLELAVLQPPRKVSGSWAAISGFSIFWSLLAVLFCRSYSMPTYFRCVIHVPAG